jgi:hypothetical protein
MQKDRKMPAGRGTQSFFIVQMMFILQTKTQINFTSFQLRIYINAVDTYHGCFSHVKARITLPDLTLFVD